MDFTPLFAITLQFRKFILGIGLIIVLAILPRSFAAVLAVILVVVLLVVLVPGSMAHLRAVWSEIFGLFAFLLMDFG